MVTPGQLVSSMSLAALGVELEGGEHDNLGFWPERLRFIEGELDLALFERRMFGAGGHDDALRFRFLRLGIGLEPAGSGEGFDC
jgi:hypothetical protein